MHGASVVIFDAIAGSTVLRRLVERELEVLVDAQRGVAEERVRGLAAAVRQRPARW